MALTAKDKTWLRRAIRDEIGSLLSEIAATQLGGYDGATEVKDDDWADESKRKGAARPIGFHVVAAAHRAQMRKR